MADQSHTPGPWSRSREYGVVASDGRGICSTGGYQNNYVDPEELQAESMANADLIASAPDLLAALRDVREELYEIRDADSVPVGTEIYLRAMQALETINAAIAKAEGGDHD